MDGRRKDGGRMDGGRAGGRTDRLTDGGGTELRLAGGPTADGRALQLLVLL